MLMTMKLHFTGYSEDLNKSVADGWKTIQLWYARSHQRRQLGQLTPEARHDLGITADAARKEMNKAFWQA